MLCSVADGAARPGSPACAAPPDRTSKENNMSMRASVSAVARMPADRARAAAAPSADAQRNPGGLGDAPLAYVGTRAR
jgi:hypothetical protein